MKDKFQNISAQKAVDILRDMTNSIQHIATRRTGFGVGFNRYIPSYDIKAHLNNLGGHQFDYPEIRSVYQELVKRKLITMQQNRSYGVCCYSLNWFDGYTAIGDYFIQDINPNSFEAQGYPPY